MRILNKAEKVHPFFWMTEFLSKDPALRSGHDLSDKVMEAVFFIREYYDTPVKINSTARSVLYNAAIGGSGSSLHLSGRAIDFSILDKNTHEAFKQDLKNQGFVFRQLRKMGINGFGMYSNFIHLDDRDKFMRSEDEYGKFQIWEEKEVFTWIRKSLPLSLVGLAAIMLLYSIT